MARKPRSWEKALERATRALAANKARIETAGNAGIASDKTLRNRSYDPDPSGGGQTVPRQVASPLSTKRKRRRRR